MVSGCDVPTSVRISSFTRRGRSPSLLLLLPCEFFFSFSLYPGLPFEGLILFREIHRAPAELGGQVPARLPSFLRVFPFEQSELLGPPAWVTASLSLVPRFPERFLRFVRIPTFDVPLGVSRSAGP